MIARMVLLAAVAVACVFALAGAAATPDQSPPPSAMRTIGREPECRPGLCPHIRRLVPDLAQAPPHVHQQLARGDFVGEPSLCGNLCVHDNSCASHQKCCPTTCGYACQDTVHIYEEYGNGQ